MKPISFLYFEKTVGHVQPVALPTQHQDRQPGLESVMQPPPISGQLLGSAFPDSGGTSAFAPRELHH
ncbi:hypothetical protein [Paenibacillus sp. FSL H3-0469]|uniref:hypothetical protein n=1 Tax=Paenibacillus sp. FSL H3-0469 TaxID=2954506 RepID=UPI003100D79C